MAVKSQAKKQENLNDTFKLQGGVLAVGDANVDFSKAGARGGDDTFIGKSNQHNEAVGDTNGLMSNGSRGGHDTFIGGDRAHNEFTGDAIELSGTGTRGGDDTFYGGSDDGYNFAVGDGMTLSANSAGGNDELSGGNAKSLGSYIVNRMVGDGYEMDGSVGGNDKIEGGDASGRNSEAQNALIGDSSVMFSSVGGNDKIYGGDASGRDSQAYNDMFGDGVALLGTSVGGNDTIYGGDASGLNSRVSNLMIGDGELVNGTSVGGNDRLYGGDATGRGAEVFNRMYGDGFGMEDGFDGGNDQLYGGDGRGDRTGGVTNLMAGDAVFIENGAHSGDDLLVGGKYALNVLLGDGFQEMIIRDTQLSATSAPADPTGGGPGSMVPAGTQAWQLYSLLNANSPSSVGNMGDDKLVGAADSESVMFGDTPGTQDGYGGSDTFVVGSRREYDIIGDLHLGDGDKIDLSRLDDDDDDDDHGGHLSLAKLAGAISDDAGGDYATIDLSKLVEGATGAVAVVGWTADELIENASAIFIL